MVKNYIPSPRQVEDWHINYVQKKDQSANVIKFEVMLPRDLNIASFTRAFEGLIRHHESLRTCFPLVDGKILQKVEDYDPAKFALIEIEHDYIYQHLLGEFLVRARNLQVTPLVQGILWKKKNEGYLFRFCIHHIIADLKSITLIKQELERLYFQLQSGDEYTFPLEMLQLGQFVEANQYCFDTKHQESINYWKTVLIAKSWRMNYARVHNTLLGQPATLAVAKRNEKWDKIHQANLIRESLGGEYVVCLETDLMEALNQFKAKTRLTTFSILVAALNLLAVKITGNKLVLIRTLFSDRLYPKTENTIGNLLGTLLLYNHINELTTVEEFITQCYQNFLDSIDRIIYNSEELETLQIISHGFLHFNYVGIEDRKLEAYNKSTDVIQPNKKADSPLFCVAREFSNTIVFTWGYNHKFYNAHLIRVMLDVFLYLLRQILDTYNKTLGECLDFIPAEISNNKNVLKNSKG